MSLNLPQQPVFARFAVAGMTAVLLGACSPDMDRFGATSDRTPVGSTLVPPSAIAGGSSLVPGIIPASRSVPRVPVGVVTASALPPVPSARTVIPASRATGSGARFAAPAVAIPPIARNVGGRVASSQLPTGTARNLSNHGRWTPTGGTSVVVGQGESVNSLERRYGIPAETLLKVNGYSSVSQVRPGTKLVIPVYNAGGKSSASIAPSRASAGTVANAASSRSVSSPVSQPQRLATADAAADKAGDRRKELAARKKELADKRKVLAARKALAAKKQAADEDTKVASVSTGDRKPVRQIPIHKPQQTASVTKEVDDNPVGSIKPASGNFRWPARGRIIRGFKKGANDGINIAVPEGTSIKAAEGGVVAYAGSELKNYGNLVLVRHPNGYVSAYAHNSQLSVKRGDKVRRGQTIAKAGRTGNVSTPQLHFELRKGANPVNPVNLLGSN
jgi:murein DD-endopeptidase MepM/ murein hydrolase activator NlpD